MSLRGLLDKARAIEAYSKLRRGRLRDTSKQKYSLIQTPKKLRAAIERRDMKPAKSNIRLIKTGMVSARMGGGANGGYP